MKLLLLILGVILLFGCGASNYDIAKSNIQKQYAELQTMDNLPLRQQRFAEIQQQEIMLELNNNADSNRKMATGMFLMNYGQNMNPPTQTYNLNIRRGW